MAEPDANQERQPDQSACSIPSGAKTPEFSEVSRSDAEWREALGPERYRVLRQRGTEPPFRNAFWNNKSDGLYLCAGCGAPLFASKQKYDSGTGWPSFYDSIASENVATTVDTSFGMTRVETHCRRCGGHLGHVFEDGPNPTGLRYCINSASLEFVGSDALAKRSDLARYGATAE